MGELRNNRERSRYEMDEQGLTSYADYRVDGGRLYVDYVYSPPPLRGSGAAGRLMAALSADARAQGLKITPICGYAAAWLHRSTEFRDERGRLRRLSGTPQSAPDSSPSGGASTRLADEQGEETQLNGAAERGGLRRRRGGSARGPETRARRSAAPVSFRGEPLSRSRTGTPP
jgi:predicted GNAT family acetyltransferase